MSRNGYSIRNRGGDLPEKRQRTDYNSHDSHRINQGHGQEGGGGESRVIYLGNIPKDWNEKIIESVVAGSGKIVDIRCRIDQTGRSKNFVFVEYSDASEANAAQELLSQILLGPSKKLKVEISKEGSKDQNRSKPVLQLNRDFLPFYVTIPSQMLQAVPTKQGQQSQQPQTLAPLSSHIMQQQPQPLAVKPEIPMPEILTKASQFLPAFNPAAFSMEDKIAENLQGLNPPQMIQLIATIKSLVKINPAAAQQVFQMSEEIPVATLQALLLMGLVDANVLRAALQLTNPKAATPIANHAQPAQLQLQPQPPLQQARHIPQQYHQPQPDPRWPGVPPHAAAKLVALPPQEAATIAQVLQLDSSVINTLPAEQQQIVKGIRAQYLG